jgi:exosortase K
MSTKITRKYGAQLSGVLLCALALKIYYSAASPDELRWILAPTTFLVTLVSGTPFTFESHAGYLSGDRRLLIAASCAGVNFLITSFLVLGLGTLWKERSRNIGWQFIPLSALFAYLVTIVANTVRISTALLLQGVPLEIGWLNPNQLHRVEGIAIYFGFLFLLFMVRERTNAENTSPIFRRSFFPLFIYYAVTLAIPLANGGYRMGIDFWEHAVFVLLTPLLLILPLALFHYLRRPAFG